MSDIQSETENPFKLGVVVALFTNKTAKITFDGEDAASEKQYAYLSSYGPKAGDRVLLAAMSGTYIILGKVNYNVPPAETDMSNPTFATLTTSGKATLDAVDVTNNLLVSKNLNVNGDITASTGSTHRFHGSYIGFFNKTPTSQKSCTTLAGSATLATVIAKVNEIIGDLQSYGLYR